MKRLLLICNLTILCLVIWVGTTYAGYLSDGWQYRGSITFPDTGTGMPIYINSDNLDADIMDYTYGNGADFRITSDSAGATDIDFKFIYPQDPFSLILINLPTGISKIYYWIGKSDVDFVVSSNVYPSSVKAAYEFNQQKAAAVSDNGKSNPIGSSTMEPSALFYDGKTYYVWQGVGYKPYIAVYDPSQSEGSRWSAKVQISTYGLTSDSHGTPVVTVDSSGYFHVFWGCHNSVMYHAKSDSPGDISAWTKQTDIGDSETYPHALLIGSVNYLIHRNIIGASHNGSTYKIRTSADNYASASTIMSSTTTFYTSIYISRCCYDSASGVIWMGWTINWDYSVSDQTYNQYCGYYKISDGHMYAYDGTDLGTEISLAEMASDCIIVDTDSEITHLPYLFLNADNLPCILFNLYDTDDYYHFYMEYDGTNWTTPEKIVASGGAFNLECGYYNGATLEAYLVTDGAGLEHWQKKSGTWSKLRTIIKSADVTEFGFLGEGIGRSPKYVENNTGDIQIVFAAGEFTDVDADAEFPIYAIDSRDNFVYNSLSDYTVSVLKDKTSNSKDETSRTETIGTTTGKTGDAYTFDGDSGAITLANNILASNDEFTFTGWVYISGDSSNEVNDRQIIFDLYYESYVFIQWAEADDATYANKFRFLSYDGSTSTDLWTTNQFTSGSWYYITIVYDTDDDLICYVNSVSEASAASVSAPVACGTGNRFGKDYTAVDRNWLYGNLDSWMIFNTGLSQPQIEVFYDNQNDISNYPSAKTDLIQVKVCFVPSPICF